MQLNISRENFVWFYRWLIISIGCWLALVSLRTEFQHDPSYELLIWAFFTALVAANVTIKLTRFSGIITVSDAFTFLALLWWDSSAAILIALVESVASTYASIRAAKLNPQAKIFLFNASVSVISIWTTAQMLKFFFVSPSRLSSETAVGSFVLAIGLMGLTHYLTQLSLVAVLQFLKKSWADCRAWLKQYYLWSCVTFFFAAGASGAIVKFVGGFNLYSIFIVSPVILLLYFTYRTYTQTLDALQESEGRFRSSFDYATVGMALVSPAGFLLETNESLRKLLKRGDAELLDSPYVDFIHADDAAKINSQLVALQNNEIPTFQLETKFVRADGETVWVLLSASTARDAQNSVRHLIFQTQDINLRKKAEARLFYDASHDALTGLQNRTAFMKNLVTAEQRAKRRPERNLAILFLDLDGFKAVNDTFGHAHGDQVLKMTAARLLECVRDIDTVARLGGDEFTILLEDLEDTAQAVTVAERIREKLTAPFEINQQTISIGTSIGIATSEIPRHTANELLRDADAAMYEAKARGKSCFVMFDDRMHVDLTRNLKLANDLRTAAQNDEFSVCFQPIYQLESETIIGFETFLRWNHALYGRLAPAEFLSLAEEYQLSTEIDLWVLENACRTLRGWREENHAAEDVFVSVNISAAHFAQSEFVEKLRETLHVNQIPPSCLKIEITEKVMLRDHQKSVEIFKNLKEIGVAVMLDDFGKGYSSLNRLHEFPISCIKIDGSLIERVTDDDSEKIVGSIVSLARGLGIKTIAENVENLDQLKYLRRLNCDAAQGYLYSRPISGSDAPRLFAAGLLDSVHAGSKANNLRLIAK